MKLPVLSRVRRQTAPFLPYTLYLFISAMILVAGSVMPGRAADTPMEIPRGSLTLERAWTMALEKNPGIKEAREKIQAARAVLKQARSAWSPRITAQGGSQAIDFSTQPDWAPQVRARDSYKEYTVGARLTWLLFDGFARDADLLASTHGVNREKQGLREAQRLILKAVATAFYQAQLTIEGMVIARQDRKFNRNLEKDARIKWQVGSGSEAEMLNFSVKALQAESNFSEARRDFRLTCTALAQLLGLPGADLPRELYPVRSLTKKAVELPPIKDALQQALEQRPDLKALDEGIEAMKQQLRSKKRSYFPVVALVSGIDYLYQKEIMETDQEEHDTYIGIAATWDIYTGGQKEGEILEIKAKIKTLAEKRSQAVLAIQASIRQARERALTAHEIYLRQEKTLGMTRRIRTHVEKAYRAGVATLTRLNQAQTDLVRASGAVAAGWLQYKIALVHLQAETGRILETKNLRQ